MKLCVYMKHQEQQENNCRLSSICQCSESVYPLDIQLQTRLNWRCLVAQAMGIFQRSISSSQAGYQYDLDSWSQPLLPLLLPWGVCLLSVCTTKFPVADMSRDKSHMQIGVWKSLPDYSLPLSEEQRTQRADLQSRREIKLKRVSSSDFPEVMNLCALYSGSPVVCSFCLHAVLCSEHDSICWGELSQLESRIDFSFCQVKSFFQESDWFSAVLQPVIRSIVASSAAY